MYCPSGHPQMLGVVPNNIRLLVQVKQSSEEVAVQVAQVS